jgi:hypothetical protein
MALRRNPQRGCQEKPLPSVTAIKSQSTIVEISETINTTRENQTTLQRRTKCPATRRKVRNPSRPILPPASDKPFPFFSLPREIRDQIYSSLVGRPNGGRSIIAAAPVLLDKKRRTASRAKRDRLNQKRFLSGKPPIRIRPTEAEPIAHLNLLQASQRLHVEAKDCLYSNNWFAITLDRLPSITFETPYGWDLSRITRLVVELQLKDAAHMNSYVDWTAFFASFTSLRFLHVIPTFHPRYHDWAYPEFTSWTTTHFVHKAFFRELLAAIPSHLDIKFGSSYDATDVTQLQGKPIGSSLLRDMYAELGPRQSQAHPLAVDRVVVWQ